MKTKLIHYIFIGVLLITFACDTLDQYPISEKSSGSFFANEQHFEQAIAACYNSIRQYKVTATIYYRLTESRCDNTFQLQDYDDGQTTRFEETNALPLLNNMWSSSYSTINRCNTILSYLQTSKIDFSQRSQIEGEARLIRGMVYFDLVRLFAGVPIVKSILSLEESYSVERSTMQEVYDFIKDDLVNAELLLPETTITGRFNKNVARAYLGKVLVFESGYPLYNTKWDEAKDWLKKVIDSGKYEFFEDFEDVFLHINESGKQSVSSFTFKSGVSGHGNAYPTRNAPRDINKTADFGILYGGTAMGLRITDDLVNSFEEGDVRLPASIQLSWQHTNGTIVNNEPYCRKYQNGPVVGANDWDIDFIDFRYDEVLLLYAECLNEIGYVVDGEAFSIINQFRKRAGLNEKNADKIPSQDAFRLWIENERRWEFIGENIRWFDLVRTNRVLDIMKSFLTPYNYGNNVTIDRYFYPIPLRATQENSNLLQDPGFK